MAVLVGWAQWRAHNFSCRSSGGVSGNAINGLIRSCDEFGIGGGFGADLVGHCLLIGRATRAQVVATEAAPTEALVATAAPIAATARAAHLAVNKPTDEACEYLLGASPRKACPERATHEILHEPRARARAA